MNPSSRLTPYPVLATYRDDYLESYFNATIDAAREFGDVHIRVLFELNEPALQKLIAEGKAEYAVHIECPRTSLRLYEGTRDGLFTITLNRQEVKGRIDICTFIIARTPIEGFVSSRFHPDYEGYSFDLIEGSVLAIGECTRIEVENNEDIERHASIMNVVPAGSGQRDVMSVNTDQSDNVLIALKPELYRIYAEYGGGAESELIFSLIIMPALQIVLTRMIDSRESSIDSEKEWYRSIVELLEKNGISLSDLDNYSENMSALSIAQRILSQPLERSLKSLVREV